MSQTFQVIASRPVAVRRLPAGTPTPTPTPTPERAVVDSHDLLRGQRELLIRHGDREYRLLHTRSDKLILTR